MSQKRNRYDTHHRKSQYLGGTDEASNLSRVRKTHHRAYHQLFPGTMKLETIVYLLNKYWIDPDYYLVICPKKKENPNQLKLKL